MAWTRTRLEVPAITGDGSVLLAAPPPDGGWTPRLDRIVTIGTIRPDRIATTEPLSEATIPVSPQAARPTVSEREIGAGGVPGCSGMPRTWKFQPAPGKACGIRGQDTVERHDGFDVVMEKIVQWEQENPASNGRGMIDDFRLRGSRRWSRTNAPPKKPQWRTGVARDFPPPTLFSQRAEPLAVVVESFPERPITPVAVASRAIEASVMGEGEGSGGGDGGDMGSAPPGRGFEGAGAPRQPQCITLGRLAPRHYAVRRRPRCPRLARRGGEPCERGAGGGTVGRDRIATTPQSPTVERFTVGAGHSDFPTGGETCGL